MFEKKKKATKKNENLMKKAPAAGAVELGDDVLEAAAGGGGTGMPCAECGVPVAFGVTLLRLSVPLLLRGLVTATLPDSAPVAWKQYIVQLAEQYGMETASTFDAHKTAWHEKWAKSYVFCPKDSEGFLFAKGFLYQRYMNLCAGKGPYPIKFNGSLFRTKRKTSAVT